LLCWGVIDIFAIFGTVIPLSSFLILSFIKLVVYVVVLHVVDV
jgi:hypothetical protein